jgi:pectin methylesterase-like acyl-CoA thioesterase
MNQPKWLYVLLLSSALAACGGSSSPENGSSSSSSSSSNPASSSSASASSEPASTVFVCPESGLYFCDDFSDGTADQWVLQSSPDNPEGEPNGTFDVVEDGDNHVLRFTAASQGGELAFIDVNALEIPSEDYYLEARIRPRENSTTGNKFLYLMARYHSEGIWYAAGLNVQNNTDSTKVEIAKSVDGTIDRPVQVGREIVQGPRDTLEGGQWYTVRFELIGDTLTVYFNGENVGSHTDTDYTGIGDIGLFTANKSFEIDDVVIGDPANKPVQLTIDPASNEWIAEAQTDDYVIDVTAVQSNGDPDTFSVESSNTAVVGVDVQGNQVHLSPLAEGEATVTFTSGSDATLVRTIEATITPAFVQPTAVYDLAERVVPAVGATDILRDTRIKLTFDDVPTLGAAGSARIYRASDDAVIDNISVLGEQDSLPSADRARTLNTEQIWVEGNSVVIAPHYGVLEPGETYYVAIADGVIDGTLNGAEFEGLGKDAAWTFSTTADAPSGNELTVAESGEADFRTVQGALSYAMLELGKDDAVTVNVMNGTYREPLYLRNKNNLTLRGESRENTRIEYRNNEQLNGGTSGRPLFLVESADMLVLEHLTIENTTLIGDGGQAETIYFNSSHRLVAKDAAFLSEQDTLLLKGYSWFYESLVAGNVDYIWGYVEAALFENSEIRTVGRSDGGSGGYILQARTPDSVKGFVFLNSELTRGEGPTGANVADNTFALARSGGSQNYFDNVVFINTRMDDHIRSSAWHTDPTPNPATATATNGWREYNSMDINGDPLDTSGWVSYSLTEEEYEAEFSTREKIFSTFNNGEGWSPLP